MTDIKKSSNEKLQEKILSNLKELLNLRMQKKIGKEVKSHLFKSLRRENARIKTLLKERAENE